MLPTTFEVSTHINGGLRFGPVCPLIDRRDMFRGQYIAVMGVEHASSIRKNLSDMITIIQLEILELEKIPCLSALPVNALNNVGKIRMDMISWGAQHFDGRQEYTSPMVFEDLIQQADYMAKDYVSGAFSDHIRFLLETSEAKDTGVESLRVIAEQIDYMKGVYKDRSLFMRRQSGTGTVAFDSIRPTLSELWKKWEIELQIEDMGGGGVSVQMSEHRLFSLFNNMIANGVIHGEKGPPIKMTLKADAGLIFSVTNTGPGIEPKYLEFTNDGYPRLFALEKRDNRVPIGSAEIWDIIGISKGWLQVDTAENSTTISGFIPETKIK